ncbi:hypothetical protein HHK36_003615 [Tetracentron sinense]|uniref:Uncharacterized protein n=1 Tax=Tetracentron sinense TaxID=13715 RepID=A0A835DPG7_TETSI|nr:hypothetical protein HHK36_003615 [Tetracentron sinense]
MVFIYNFLDDVEVYVNISHKVQIIQGLQRQIVEHCNILVLMLHGQLRPFISKNLGYHGIGGILLEFEASMLNDYQSNQAFVGRHEAEKVVTRIGTCSYKCGIPMLVYQY